MTARNAFAGLATEDGLGTDGTPPDAGTGIRGLLGSVLAAMRDSTQRVRLLGLSPTATQIQAAVDASGNLIVRGDVVGTISGTISTNGGSVILAVPAGASSIVVTISNPGGTSLSAFGIAASRDGGASYPADANATLLRRRTFGTIAALASTFTSFGLAANSSEVFDLPALNFTHVKVQTGSLPGTPVLVKIDALAAVTDVRARLVAGNEVVGAFTGSLTSGVGTSVGQGLFTRGAYASYASTTALLAAAATYTASGFTSLYPTMRFQIVSDQPGTLVIKDSAGRSIRTYSVTAVTAGVAWFVDIADGNLGSTSSFTFTNTGGATQTVFALNCNGVSP